jgi:MYXO-CTERM domain-containing protein
VAACTTTTAFPGTCQPTATTCLADSDCPSAWTCIDLSGSGNATGTGTAPGGTTTGAGGVGGGVSGAPAPTDQPTAVSSDSPPSDPKIAPDLVAPQKVCQSPYGDFGRSSTPTSNGSPTGGASDPALPPTGEKSLAAEDSAQAQSSGCAVAAHNAKDGLPAATAGLALLGLMLAGRRRTRR